MCYIIEWILEIFMAQKFGMGIFSQGRHSLIWPIRVCAAEQGTVFKVLSLKQGIEFHYWVSWTGCLFRLEVNSKSVKTKWWAVYICNTNNFYLNLYFHNFSVKNYLILYAKQTNQGQKVVSPVLNRVAKWAIFVLNRVRVWRPWRHTSSQTSLVVPPPPRIL